MKIPKYDDLTIAELKSLAKSHGLKISSKAKKSELILALQAHLSSAKTTQKSNKSKKTTTSSKSTKKQSSKLTSKTSTKAKPKTLKPKSKSTTTKVKAKITPKASLANTQKTPLKQASKPPKKTISKKTTSQTKAPSSIESASKPTLSTKPQATDPSMPQSKPKMSFEVTKPKVATVFPLTKPHSSSKIPPKPLADTLHPFSKQNIVAMTVSSKKIYTYWEVSTEVTHLDSHRLNIKVINKKTGEFFYLPITKPKDEAFVDVKPGAKYELQIGKVSKNGKFKPIEKSQVVSVPALKHTAATTTITTTTTHKAPILFKPTKMQTKGKTFHLTVKPIGRLPQKFFEFVLTEGSY